MYYVRSTNKNKSPVQSKPTKLFIQPKNLDAALKLLGERDAKAKQKNPITTPKQIYADLKNHFVEFPKDHVVGSDPVNHPPHYKSGGIETIDFIEAKDLNYRLGNVIKYVSRAGKKSSDPIEDLKKAQFYLNREIAIRERA